MSYIRYKWENGNKWEGGKKHMGEVNEVVG